MRLSSTASCGPAAGRRERRARALQELSLHELPSKPRHFKPVQGHAERQLGTTSGQIMADCA